MYEKHFLPKMAFERVLHRIRKGLFQIYRSEDGTATAFSLTHSQPENFCLLAVVFAAAALLDYVFRSFYLSNIRVYTAVSLLCLCARSKLGDANSPTSQ